MYGCTVYDTRCDGVWYDIIPTISVPACAQLLGFHYLSTALVVFELYIATLWLHYLRSSIVDQVKSGFCVFYLAVSVVEVDVISADLLFVLCRDDSGVTIAV